MGEIFKRLVSRGTGSRSRKTAAALYRILREEFESRRGPGCSCVMPMVFACENALDEQRNWCVEQLWCGSADCRRAMSELMAHNAQRFELVDSAEENAARSNASASPSTIAQMFEV